jgi:hypothetical protein
MSKSHGKFTALFFSVQALAVAIIIFGSLINFHQYKIWGKPLIPNFIGYKRDVEKYSKTFSFAKLKVSQSGQDCSSDSELDIHGQSDVHSCDIGSLIYLPAELPVKALFAATVCGLRGPPLS